VKDLIISGGENVHPAEVEGVIAAHPAVAEAVVVGVPHPRWGEVPHAVVVPAPGRALVADELIAFCRERLASYKTPGSVVMVGALPRTGAGKVDRAAVRAVHGCATPASDEAARAPACAG
jgi:acyl-CoA synthetase (AMP-forming)/AMP-acid ligase II